MAITGCVTATGINDDGTGTRTPQYAVKFVGTNSDVVINGNDLTGYTVAAINGTNPTRTSRTEI